MSLCAPGSVTESPSPGGEPGSGGGAPRPPRLGDFFFLGTACAISVIGAGAAGYALDAWLGTAPWLTFAGLAFGIISAVLICVAEVRKFS
ncbi:MAG: AtpZ/AtpI family protein [Acidimicrobiales bacterium]